MKIKLAIGLAAAFLALPAHAQLTASQITAGMQVYHGDKQAVGVVTGVKNGMAVVATGKYSVPVNPASFALDRGRLYLGMTQAALHTYYETQVLPAQSSLMVGKPVKGIEGTTLGTISAIDDGKVVITLAGGTPIQLPRSAILGAATGATVGVSAADLEKQLGASATASSAAQVSAPTGTPAK